MADWSKPTLTSTYANYLSETTGRDVDCAVQFSTGTITSPPTGAIKWNSSLGRWQLWSGTAWGELAATYNLTALTCTTFSATGNATLGDSSADTVTVNAASWNFANTTTLTGVVNFTGTLQFGSKTVATLTGTETLTNKTISGGTIDAGADVGDTGYSTTIAVSAPGFRGKPTVTVSADYTLVVTDAGKMVRISAGAVTIPANSTLGLPVGTSIMIYNNSSSTTRTIQMESGSTDILRLAGTTTTGSRTLAIQGIARLTKVQATAWVIDGNVS